MPSVCAIVRSPSETPESYWPMVVRWQCSMSTRPYKGTYVTEPQILIVCWSRVYVCVKYGNAMQHFVPFSGNQIAYATLRRSFSKELNTPSRHWHCGYVNIHTTILNKCLTTKVKQTLWPAEWINLGGFESLWSNPCPNCKALWMCADRTNMP